MNTELLPEWTDCQSAFASGTATPLTEFIRAYEPIQSTRPDDKSADEWRQALASVLEFAATRMRDACVEKVQELARRDRHYGAEYNLVRALGYDLAASELESITLEAAADSIQKDNEHHG